MAACGFSISLYIAMLLATNLVIEAKADDIVGTGLAMKGNICQIEKGVAAQQMHDFKYQALGLPQNYADCMVDYTTTMTLLKLDMDQEYKFISCLQKEVNKGGDPELIESLSKQMAGAALRLRELRQSGPNLEQKAMAERKVCEQAVDALSKYKFDGTYVGHFAGGAHGSIKLVVRGTTISGSISGTCTASPCGADPMVGRLSGQVAADGSFTAVLNGTLTDSSGMLGSIAFSGAVNGRIAGAQARGDWNGKNQYGAPSGDWSASR